VSVDRLVARAEVLKLARLLNVPPEELDYLAGCTAADLATVREQVTDALFDGDRHRLRRIADAGRIVPLPVMAAIGEKAFGPLLCARLTGLLEPGRAAAVGSRLPAPFLADVACELDPRRATEVITRMPAELLTTVARILGERGEAVPMGRFVGFLDDDVLVACTSQIGDAELLRTAFVLEGKDRLDRVIELLPDSRLARVLDVLPQTGLWVEALDLLAHLGDDQLARLAGLTDGRDPAPYAPLRREAERYGAGDVVTRARSHGIPVP
jgi:hypothetical protein